MDEKKTIAELLSENALNTHFEDLSENNIRICKDKLLDNIGNLAGGALAFGNREVLEIVDSYGETGEAPVFFLKGKASLGDAAMINAMSSRSNDYEPMFMNLDGTRLPSKESATLINAALTAGAVYGFSGKDYIAHEVVGEDLSVRIMAAGGRWNFDVGWDSSFTMPIYGVCAQLGRIRRLTPLQLRDAWGIAMGMVGGTMSHIFDYATSAKLGAGYNIRNADFATRLAKKGFPSLINIFEGPRNLYHQYRGMDEACDPKYLREGLGEKYYMEESIKLYPVGSPATIVAFAGSELYGICDPADITDIELAVPDGYVEMYYWPPYETGRDPLTHAQFSYQYALCAPLLWGAFRTSHYSEEHLTDPELLRLCSITRMIHDDTLPTDKTGGATTSFNMIRVTITTKDGKTYSVNKSSTDFNMHNYPTREQLLDKYWDQVNTYGLLSKAAAEKCIELVDHLEDLKDIRELTELLI
ncbi:MAG: MmgE/PrpD family protein [Lachnospiraceae bacterium]|nr:MmgE/PrpD family protein [Lachnospiraceae bacterium]